MTVGEMETRMTASEYDDWIAYYAVEPFGAWRDNYHAGLICSLLANVNRKRGTPALKPKDFLLVDEHTRKEENKQKFRSALKALARKNSGDRSS